MHLILHDRRKVHRFREGADGTSVDNINKEGKGKVHCKGNYAEPLVSGECAHYY